MKKLFYIYIILLFAMPIAAQTGSVSGIVIDSANNAPLVGTVIKIKDTKIGAIADENGKYEKNSADALAINRRYGTNISLTFGYTIK